MSRILYVEYDEYGLKFGKVNFYLDNELKLSLSNHEAGKIEIPDEYSHIVSVKRWGFIPVFKDRIYSGSSDWQLEFVQRSRKTSGYFVLSRVENE